MKLVLITISIYRLIIIGATGYVVFGLGHSGWWFALAILFCDVSVESK